VADVAEALIAANYLSNDSHIDAAISALRNLHMDLSGFTKWEDVVSASQEGQRTAQDNDTDRLDDGDRLPITIFGHTFADGWIGRDALVSESLFASSNTSCASAYLCKQHSRSPM